MMQLLHHPQLITPQPFTVKHTEHIPQLLTLQGVPLKRVHPILNLALTPSHHRAFCPGSDGVARFHAAKALRL